MKNINHDRQLRRRLRISRNIHGTADKPRIIVFRSNKYIYAQAIDDQARKTLIAFSSLKLVDKKINKSQQSKSTGRELAKLMKEKGIDKAVFDRSSYSYNGRVKSLAEGMREGGIKI